jgi:hypothetical protein
MFSVLPTPAIFRNFNQSKTFAGKANLSIPLCPIESENMLNSIMATSIITMEMRKMA